MPGFNELSDHEQETLERLSLVSLEHELNSHRQRSATYYSCEHKEEESMPTHSTQYVGQSYTIHVHKDMLDSQDPIIDVEYAEYNVKHNNAESCHELSVVDDGIVTQRVQLRASDAMPYNANEALLYAVDNNKTHIDNIMRRSHLDTSDNTALAAISKHMSLLTYSLDTFMSTSNATKLSSRFYLANEHKFNVSQFTSTYVHIGRHAGAVCARAAIRDFHISMNDMRSPLNVTSYLIAESTLCLAQTYKACENYTLDIGSPNLQMSSPFQLRVSANVHTQAPHNIYTTIVPTSLATLLLLGTSVLVSKCKFMSLVKDRINIICCGMKRSDDNEAVDDANVTQLEDKSKQNHKSKKSENDKQNDNSDSKIQTTV